MNKSITFLIESLSNGGAERVTSILANNLSCRGYDINLIILNKNENEYIVNNNINKIYLDNKQYSIKFVRVLKRIIYINKLINKLNSDVIISLSMPSTNFNLILPLLNNNKKVILSERNDPKAFPRSKLIRLLRTVTYKLANVVVFQTNEAMEYFSTGIKAKGFIISNPIKEDLPNVYIGERKHKIVNFCRIDAQKNLNMLIDAFSLLYKQHNDYTLSIYGDGPLKDELKKYIDINKIYNVNLHGYTKNIHELIVDSTMFVSSSNYEGISNSMLESLAIGLPTICTDCPVGGARMFIKPYENGLLVPVGDTNSLYEAMKELIENEELCKKLSNNAIKIREELSVDKIVNKWLNIIEK